MKKTLFRLICTSFLVIILTSGITAEAKTVPVRVMSYNIHFGVGMDGKYDLERIANVIQNSKVDIGGLQEVDVQFQPLTHLDNQIELLAKKWKMY